MTYGRVAVPISLLTLSLSWSSACARANTELLPVSARIVPSCDIGGSDVGTLQRGAIDFGNRTLTGGETILIAGNLPIHCSGAASPAVTLDNGQNATGQQRNLRGPDGALLAYDLLRGAGGDAPLWDNQPHSVSLDGSDLSSVPISGRIVLSNAVPADGVYTDIVRVRIDY